MSAAEVSRSTPSPARRWVRSPLLAAAALVGLVLLARGPLSGAHAEDPPAGSEATAITEAPPLTWGFKASWRSYARQVELADGAVAIPESGAAPYNLQWEFRSGSYEAASGTTRLDYAGSAHWLKYPAVEYGYAPPPGEPDADLLDVTVTDPRITIGPESSLLTAEVTSREFSGDRTLRLIHYGRVPLENLEVLGVTPTVENGTTTWEGIGASLTEQGDPAFAGFYNPGTTVDPVSFTYTGLGGAPDLSEHLDRPGRPKLKLVKNELFIDNRDCGETLCQVGGSTLGGWIDQKNLITNFSRSKTVDGVPEQEFIAFDLKKMKRVGDPLVLANSEAPELLGVLGFDTTKDRLLYRTEIGTGITHWIQFNAVTESYEAGTFSDPKLSEPSFIGQREDEIGLAWNDQRDFGYRVSKESGAWQLVTYKEDEATKEWERSALALPTDTLESKPGYVINFNSSWSLNRPVYATASDGSLIVLGRLESEADGSTPATTPAAYRLVLAEVRGKLRVKTVEALPLDVPTGQRFEAVQTAANGQILLTELGGEGLIGHCQIQAGGSVACDPAVPVARNVEPGAYKQEDFAVDPDNGLTWYAATATQVLAPFAEGRFLGGEPFKERNPSGGPIVIGEDHTVYVQTNDAGPKEIAGSATWGWGKYELLGFTPTVSEQPQPATVSLGEGETAKTVTFSSAATSESTITRQWQVKVLGSARYKEIPGAEGQTLTVQAEAAMNGNEYRAVYENAIGKIASEPATLIVHYAPSIKLQVSQQTVTEGADATFSVVTVGNPTPTITWQRRVSGFWQNIAEGDPNFTIGNGTLTVRGTNVEQTGARFRAEITNSAGTVYSREVRLTVSPRVEIPEGGIAVTRASLDWLGNEEMQSVPFFGGSDYFSAGLSSGDEASYRSVDGNAAIWQVSPSGTEALATYVTRAYHVAGGRQVARLYGGTGRVEPDGSADISWGAAFSVNFYGGLVPFTIEDPELTVDPDGSGTLTATLVGCSSSMANSSECSPLAPASEVVVADFTDATVEPGKALTIEPRYLGVTVDVPTGTGAQPQVREGTDWGSWPQSFVDFQLQTGLNSYWYSSGLNDERKPPLPFTVNLEGPQAPGSEPDGEGKTPAAPDNGSTGGGSTQPAPTKKPKGTPAKVKFGGRVRLNGKGTARVATLACPQGGVGSCEAIVPARLATRIAGKRYLISVKAPRKIKAGRSAPVTMTLPKAARRALGGHPLTVRLRIVVRSGKRVTSKVARVTLVGRS